LIVRSAIFTIVLLLGLSVYASKGRAVSADSRRFFYSGDGQIHLIAEKSGRAFYGRFRTRAGTYDTAALRQICLVFGAPYGPQQMGVSLRLIEFLDFLEDRHNQGARITITSGYRSPEYNTSLRKHGRLAAKASLHQYGMAVDLKMQGVPSKRIWEEIKNLGFGGAGYYMGETVHVDVGPHRSWDQNSSGVGTGISDDNKLINLVTDYDIYRPGEPILLRFTRMTAFPIGVLAEFYLESAADPSKMSMPFKPAFAANVSTTCPKFERIDQMASIGWRLPEKIAPGRYQIRAKFCNNAYPDMPAEVSTPEFEIVK
jgi:uncharacterized protein YcbK (DUF882 family)